MRNNILTRSILLLLSALLLLSCLLLLSGFVLPNQYEETFLGEMKDKQQRLAETEGPRIIVIGGSSVPFSMNSASIQKALPGWSVIDFGMYADLGTLPMLDWAKPLIREGDLVVVSPEQNAQALSCFVGGESVWQACDGAFSMLKDLKPSRWEDLAASFPFFAGKKLRYTLFGSPKPEGIYTHAAFNAFGDIAEGQRPFNLMTGGFQPSVPISFDPDLPADEFIDELNDFAASVREQGGEIVYHFSPMNAAALENGTKHADIDHYYDVLSEKLAFSILGDPHRSILESGWFYDSNFHLNDAGALLYSRILVEDLKLFLLDTTPTTMPLPLMPVIPEHLVDGDDSQAACFTYRETEGGRIITGLTEQGQSAEMLILPTHADQQPVIGLEPDVFAGNLTLREVTVQPNIAALPDGMFSGCLRLETLHLTASQPSAYSVGDGLMQGASFRIRVPQDALDAYRRSYFWQQYEAWIIG